MKPYGTMPTPPTESIREALELDHADLPTAAEISAVQFEMDTPTVDSVLPA